MGDAMHFIVTQKPRYMLVILQNITVYTRFFRVNAVCKSKLRLARQGHNAAR